MSELKNHLLERFKEFENRLNGESSSSVHDLRKKAISAFSSLDFPSVKEEEWKYTNIAPLLKHNFKPASQAANLKKEDVSKFLFKGLNASLMVFVNGIFNEELSDIKAGSGITVENISSAISSNNPALYSHLGKYAEYGEQIFTSLSTAFIKDGAFIYIPDGKVAEYPVHILFISAAADEKVLSQPRNLFVAGKNSQATIIEHYVSLDDETYFTNSVTEVYTDENAYLDHVKLQQESRNAFHIARMEVGQERTSNFRSHSISFGGSITRNDFNTRFGDEGGECTLNGLYMIEDDQLFDAHTMIDHAKPNCNSHEHYKGILDGRSRGVFNGKVMVRKDAQKTNAFQENNNIILSADALVNTKPQLEIFADDVKCSHGATIGQLDQDAMFYLKSRGIGIEAGRAILIHAFASDVVQSIKVQPVRDYVEEILTKKFNA